MLIIGIGGLFAACQGDKEIVDYMISKGADNWNWGLQAACERNHIEMAEYMISKGADHCSACGLMKNHQKNNIPVH